MSTSSQAPAPVVRKKVWHHKARTGCIVCRARRVKCDETRPNCQKCMKLGRECEYASTTSKSFITAIPIMPARMYPFESPLSQHDFHFYQCTGAPMIAQWYCPSFWLTMLPTNSETSSAIHCALLAMSATTQQFMSTSTEMIQLVAKRGDIYYGKACSMLMPGSSATVEETLNTSFVLWCYDLGFGRQSQSFIHANAAVKLFQSLANGQPSSQRSELSRESRNLLLDVGRTFFHDMHFPMENSEFLGMLERRARLETKTAHPTSDNTCNTSNISNTTIHRPLPLFNPFAGLANPTHINSFFWLIIVADSVQALCIIQQALDHCVHQCVLTAHPKSREQQTFENQILLFQLFCQMYITDARDGDYKSNDQRMSLILDLIQANMQLIATEKVIPLQHDQCPGLGQQGIHCYLGVLGVIGQRAHDPAIRFRAFSQIISHGTPAYRT